MNDRNFQNKNSSNKTVFYSLLTVWAGSSRLQDGGRIWRSCLSGHFCWHVIGQSIHMATSSYKRSWRQSLLQVDVYSGVIWESHVWEGRLDQLLGNTLQCDRAPLFTAYTPRACNCAWYREQRSRHRYIVGPWVSVLSCFRQTRCWSGYLYTWYTQ